MKSAHIVFMVMVLIFVFFELAYAFLVFEIGDQHVEAALVKSAVLLLFIILYSKKVRGSKQRSFAASTGKVTVLCVY